METNENWLSYIQDKWSSKDPRDRVIGWIGKLVVEGGLFILASTILSLLVFCLFWVVDPAVQALDAALGVGVSAMGIFYSSSFCKIITEK